MWKTRLVSFYQKYGWYLKAGAMALLPLLCCFVACRMDGHAIGDVYLPSSEWNDELFYYKQTEGILGFGYPQGYFGFNESHALKLSFAAWSPVLLVPWVLWGLLFGWGFLSPITCNIFLMMLTMFCFVLLVKPSGKQMGILVILFSLFVPFVRYMLSGMPEVVCFSLLILFYALALSYFRHGQKGWKLVGMTALSVFLTLMRPYLVLFLLLPLFLWVKRTRSWKSLAGAAGVLCGTVVLYALIKHELGAEYFTPLFKTEWLSKFLQDGLWAGCRNVLSTLWYQGKDFSLRTLEGFRSGLAEGAYFACYLMILLILTWQTLACCFRQKWENALLYGHMAVAYLGMLAALLLMYKLTEGSKHLLTFLAAGIFLVSVMETRFYKKAMILGALFAFLFVGKGGMVADYQIPYQDMDRSVEIAYWEQRMEEGMTLDRENAPGFQNVVIWVFSDVQAEGGVESQTNQQAAGDEEIQTDQQAAGSVESQTNQQAACSGELQTDQQAAGSGEPQTDQQAAVSVESQTDWQALYGLPRGFGISCCYRDYVADHFEDLQSRYLATVSGGTIDRMCGEAGFHEVGRLGNTVIYRRY